ncbi:MAG: chemotaxis response regulator protein-glutamate methylesterase [Geobacter sp.]|nr:chemotaxis response regulator protein-glutamate methylesterase [Geobacter sp.]
MSNSASNREKIKVLVVDDSSFIRRTIIKMFDNHPDIRIIDVAADGEMAIRLIKEQRPDVVTLDVQMPVLDGIAALERIMQECPVPVVMLSSLTGKGGDQTLRALELGAVDFIDKSTAGGPMEFASLFNELTAKLLVAAKVDLNKLGSSSDAGTAAVKAVEKPAASPLEAVLIGVSTGGPPALQAILSSLPPDFPCPILIVQHMPVGFTASLAERLNRTCAIAVKEAQNGETLLPGKVYIAPGGTHLKVRRTEAGLTARLDDRPSNTLHHPSVDVLLESAAEICGNKAAAFILTGMGKDGAAGAQRLKQVGGKIVVESEKSAIVFGMPKAVMDLVKVDEVVHLTQVADYMVKITSR